MRVVAALSGGVDSAVAAARLVDEGNDVVGVHMALAGRGHGEARPRGGCCSVVDAHDAARVADALGIDFYVWDFAAEFESRVVNDFLAEYAAGRTPNPCVRCNEEIKFGAMVDRAVALGFDAVATGHYARRTELASGGVGLRRAIDRAKDQSYVLSTLTPAQLERARFPLGESLKADVRVEAATKGLRVADKPDSSDVCFIPDGDLAGWLRERLGPRPGPVIDASTGRAIGAHEGAAAYTVGQRRGLRLAVPDAACGRRYVVEVDVARDAVLVGDGSLLDVDLIEAHDVVRHTAIPDGFECEIQFRAHGEPVRATASIERQRSGKGRGPVARISLFRRVRGVAHGQILAIYANDEVVGAGTIGRTALADARPAQAWGDGVSAG